MKLFSRRTDSADVRATAGCSTASVAAGGLGSVTSVVGTGRDRAMAIPTVSRARDLLVSLISSCPIRQYGTQWAGESVEEIPLPPEPWMLRPDPRTTRAHTLAWLADDLIFHGRAFLYVTARNAQGFPSAFQWIPSVLVTVQAQLWGGNAPITDITAITLNGTNLPVRDVVCFWSPTDPALRKGARAFATSERLDIAAQRFANTPAAFGWLQQTGGEPLSGDELAELAAGWAEARDNNAIAGLNEFVQWNESQMDPSRLQLIDARRFQATECSRTLGVPAYLTNADAGTGMTYQNAQQAASDLVTFGALPLLETIEQTFSSDQVTPRGRIVRLDRSYWLDANPLSTGSDPGPANTPAPAPNPNGVPA